MTIYKDCLTGLMIDDKDEPYIPMHYVCTNHDLLRPDLQAMGFGSAHALFATAAEAKRYQLAEGIRATTHIETF